MKRYIFGLFAAAIAICSAAFTTAPKSRHFATKFFDYSGPNYTQSNVANPANWTYVGNSPSGSCNGTNTKACEIEVNTMLVNPDNTLQSTVNIPTSASSTNVYRVDAGGDLSSRTNRN